MFKFALYSFSKKNNKQKPPRTVEREKASRYQNRRNEIKQIIIDKIPIEETKIQKQRNLSIFHYRLAQWINKIKI